MKLLAVFLPCVLLCISAQLIESPPEVQLFLLQLRVRLLTNKLCEKCPDLIVDEGFLRDKSGDSLTVEQNIEIEQQGIKETPLQADHQRPSAITVHVLFHCEPHRELEKQLSTQ